MYPNLTKLLKLTNPNLLITTLKRHFANLFDLDSLEYMAGNPGKKNNYYHFFEQVVKKSVFKNTEDEIVKTIIQGLHEHRVDPFQFFLNPRCDEEQVRLQLGYVEKLATGVAKPAEALSMLDMLRCVSCSNLKNSSEDKKIRVIPKQSLQYVEEYKGYYMINLNENLQKDPIWVIVYPQNKIVYSEFPLLESEKTFLLQKWNDLQFSTGNAAQGISSGYAALAWVDKRNGTQNFSPNADFWLLRHEVFREYFRDYKQSYQKLTPSDRALVTNEFDYFLQQLPSGFNLHALLLLSRIAFSGNAGFPSDINCNFTRHDIQALLEKIDEQGLQYDFLDILRMFYLRLSMPGFDTTLINSGVITEDADTVKFAFNDLNLVKTIKRKHTIPSNMMAEFSAGEAFIQADDSELPTVALVTTFRTAAKKRKLTIDFGNFELYKLYSQAILAAMQENAYVTEIISTNNNQSIERIKQELVPILARNNFLYCNQYRPGLMSDHWQEAAVYWTRYLHQHNDVLLPTAAEHEAFKKDLT